jgi:7-cyano-7-deazaguanine synthase
MSNSETPSNPGSVPLNGKTLSVVLLSGGLDSAANLAFAAERDTVVLALHIDYGQRAAAPEWRAARALAEYYGVKIERLDLSWLGALGGSSLTDKSRAVPELRESELDTLPKIQESARSVWVPNRNGVFLNVAGAFAERFRAKRVVVGFNLEEATTFPDNSQAFLDQTTRAFSYSTMTGAEAFCYTTAMDKTEIVRALKTLSRPFPHALVWSCYHAGSEPCGRCESCGRHDRALRDAGVVA